MDIAKKVLTKEKVCSIVLYLCLHVILIQINEFNMFHTGDPYVGSRNEEIKRKNNKIDALKSEVNRLKSQVKALEQRYMTTMFSLIRIDPHSPGLTREVAMVEPRIR